MFDIMREREDDVEMRGRMSCSSGKGKTKKPHAVCIPVPYQSHISAMLKLAKLLHSTGFHITFVNTDFNHQRILRSRGPRSLDGIPGFRFRSIPDGVPDPSDLETNKDGALMCEAMMNSMIAPFRDLLQDLVNASSSSDQEEEVTDGEVVPPPSCIVTDGFMSFATDWAGQKLGIPLVSFFTISACSLMGFRHFHALMDKGLIPLKDSSYLTNGYLDTIIDWIPGMNSIKLKELPTYLQTTDPENSRFKFGSRAPHRIHKASAVIIHTFDALETDVLNALSMIHPRVYAIGPLQLLLDKLDDDGLLASLESNLWEEDMDCLRWLNSQEPDSVMYVNFGSVAHLTQDQLIEFAYGLANSDRCFLWALRPGMIEGSGAAATLLSEIVEETKGRGMISAWCPQEQVLNHPAIAGFLTHCGWSSVLESLSAGLPMLCWPCFGDQSTNCKYICTEWEVGLQLGKDAKRDEVKRLVRELMAGDSIGMKLKQKAMHWKKLAHQATGPTGSSSTSFETLVNTFSCEKEKL